MLYHVEDNIVYEMLKCVLNPLREDLLKELFRHYNAKRMGKIICSNVEMEKLFKEVPDEIVATLGLTMTKRIALKAEYQNEYI